MRRFELVEGTSSKFWEVEQVDADLNIRWGRIGSAGQSQTKSFAGAAQAAAAATKLVSEKTGKGYKEVTIAAGASIGKTEATAKAPATEATALPPPSSTQAVSAPATDPATTGAAEAEPAPRVDAAATETPAASSLHAAPATVEPPPWLGPNPPVQLTAEMQGAAYASRRFPQPIAAQSAGAAWRRVRHDGKHGVHLAACDPVLLPAAQRMLERRKLEEPTADAEADALLLSFALHTTGYHGESERGEAIVDYLVAQYGLLQAVDIFVAALRVAVESRYDATTRKITSSFAATVGGTVSSGWRGPLGQGEAALRRQLAAASDADWTACADRLEAAAPSLHPARQGVLGLLLPDRPELSNALALRLGAAKEVPETVHWLLLTVTDPAAIAIAARTRFGYSTGFWGHKQMVATAVQERGVGAIAVLEKGATLDEAGEALLAIGTPEAVSAIARVASASKPALARLSSATERWPQASLVALSRLVVAGGKDAGLFASSLNRLLRAHGGLVDGLRPWLDAGAQGVVDRQLALLSGPREVARPDELPSVLAAPPWLAKAQKKAASVLDLEPLTLAPVERWTPAGRETALRVSPWQQHRRERATQDVMALVDALGFEERKQHFGALGEAAARAIRQRDVAALTAAWLSMLEARRKAPHFWFRFDAQSVTLLPPELAVPFWNAVAGETETSGAEFVMASLGLPALPGLFAVVRSKPTENLAVALQYGAVELALPAARAFAKLKSLRGEGRAWLLEYPEHAAFGLIAPALGKAGEARDCAGSALRLLQANGHRDLLREVAGRHGPEAVQGLNAVLDESPLDRFPTRRSRLPEFWQPRGWRRPELKNGKALPDEALDHLGQMLTFPTSEEIYAGIEVVRQACRPETLADFAWDAFNAWLEAGAPGKDSWALSALGLFGNDDVARRLTPFLRAWPGEAAHARAVSGLDALAAIGTDVALMLLNGIAQKVKFKGLQDRAREKVDAIAEARGLTTEELEDRLAPDLGLDEQGTLRLDFGPRAFSVGFDETLKPHVRELDASGRAGARLPDLPKPKKTDDAALSKEAVERFKLLKKDARTIASQQVLRLEVAMCARRRWTRDVFRVFLVEHPLVRHLVQRLIWGVYEVGGGGSYGGRLQACFRVAEDGSLATAADDPFEMPATDDVRIGVPHALELPPADAAAFGQRLGEYELLQPFPQLGRDTYTLDESERQARKLERWKGTKVPTGRVLGLVNRGWRRGQAQDGGGIWYFTKALGADRVIELHLDPGIIVGMVDENPEQELGSVVVGKPSAWGDTQNLESFTTVDAISASELIRDLETLRA